MGTETGQTGHVFVGHLVAHLPEYITDGRCPAFSEDEGSMGDGGDLNGRSIPRMVEQAAEVAGDISVTDSESISQGQGVKTARDSGVVEKNTLAAAALASWAASDSNMTANTPRLSEPRATADSRSLTDELLSSRTSSDHDVRSITLFGEDRYQATTSGLTHSTSPHASSSRMVPNARTTDELYGADATSVHSDEVRESERSITYQGRYA